MFPRTGLDPSAPGCSARTVPRGTLRPLSELLTHRFLAPAVPRGTPGPLFQLVHVPTRWARGLFHVERRDRCSSYFMYGPSRCADGSTWNAEGVSRRSGPDRETEALFTLLAHRTLVRGRSTWNVATPRTTGTQLSGRPAGGGWGPDTVYLRICSSACSAAPDGSRPYGACSQHSAFGDQPDRCVTVRERVTLLRMHRERWSRRAPTNGQPGAKTSIASDVTAIAPSALAPWSADQPSQPSTGTDPCR